MSELVQAAPSAVMSNRSVRCPSCGRRYVEVFYEPKAQKASYRCVGMFHGGGCGHVWREK